MEQQHIDQLRERVKTDKTLADMLACYSTHNRDFRSSSLRSVRYAMKRNGITHPYPKIRAAFKYLASLGVGKYVEGPLGDALLDKMRISTSELGALAMVDSKNVRRYGEDRKARGVDSAAEAVGRAPETFKVYPMRRSSSLSITLTINGAEVVLPLPTNLNPEQLAVLIERLRRVEDGYDPRRK